MPKIAVTTTLTSRKRAGGPRLTMRPALPLQKGGVASALLDTSV